jgi:hypothetical protein
VDQQSLLDAGSSWTTQNGVKGRIFGSDSNIVFLPAAGYRRYNDGALNSVDTYGHYWSSTHYESIYAYDLDFFNGYAGLGNYKRECGY